MEIEKENASLTLQLFGIFRDLEPSGHLKLEAKFPIRVDAFKELVLQYLTANLAGSVDVGALLKTSVLATDSRVLNDSDLIHTDDRLALLPPVCGG